MRLQAIRELGNGLPAATRPATRVVALPKVGRHGEDQRDPVPELKREVVLREGVNIDYALVAALALIPRPANRLMKLSWPSPLLCSERNPA